MRGSRPRFGTHARVCDDACVGRHRFVAMRARSVKIAAGRCIHASNRYMEHRRCTEAHATYNADRAFALLAAIIVVEVGLHDYRRSNDLDE